LLSTLGSHLLFTWQGLLLLQEKGVVWQVWVLRLQEGMVQTLLGAGQSTSVWQDWAKAPAAASARHSNSLGRVRKGNVRTG
jgi:hypothetical protein